MSPDELELIEPAKNDQLIKDIALDELKQRIAKLTNAELIDLIRGFSS